MKILEDVVKEAVGLALACKWIILKIGLRKKRDVGAV